MEFLRGRCKLASSGKLCSNCAHGWVSNEFIGIPESMPDYSLQECFPDIP